MNEPLCEETWAVSEGAAGMENQCLGLAERLPLPVRAFRVSLKKPWRWLAPYSIGSSFWQAAETSDRLAPPWPRLLIGCGRTSVPFSRAVKRASGGRTITVQCQDPRVDPAYFDLVVPPGHDRLSGPNVFPILGSPNRITAKRLAVAREHFAPLFARVREPRLAVLIGGASWTHGSLTAVAAEWLGDMLRRLALNHGIVLSTSRRTVPEAVEVLRRHLARTGAFIWDGGGENPYLGMLAWADALVVTADSVNMICEAVSTGQPVHVFPVPGARSKADIFQETLNRIGVTRPFYGKIEQWSYEPLDETGRAAERIAALLDLGPEASDMTRKGP